MFYTFLKNENIDWRKILQLFSKHFFKIVEQKGDESDVNFPKCIIIGDTQLSITARSLRKRFDDYESFGALFRQLCQEIMEATLVDKIWKFLIEIFSVLFGELEIELEILIKTLFQNRIKVEEKIKNSFDCFFSIPKVATSVK